MFEYLGYGIGGVGLLSTIFMTGHTIATKSKLESFVKKDDCIKHRDDIIKQLGSIHEKINTVAIDTAEIKGYLNKNAKK